jgi:hypothetical protein
LRFPSSDFFDYCFFVRNAAIKTLFGERAEFGLGHVQPTAVLRRVMPFEAFDESSRFAGRVGLIE